MLNASQTAWRGDLPSMPSGAGACQKRLEEIWCLGHMTHGHFPIGCCFWQEPRRCDALTCYGTWRHHKLITFVVIPHSE
jgi:hypothetical protein